jgi:Protein of unknown function (DUF3300)
VIDDVIEFENAEGEIGLCCRSPRSLGAGTNRRSNKLALERRRIHLVAAIPISRYLAALASFALFALVCNAPLSAQEGATPGAVPPPALSAAQVAELVAPIALYPDALLGQVLTASTYPLEVVMAARWSAENPNVKGPALEGAMQQQAWDPSVKALAAVPQTLTMMSDKLEWTKALGDAYLAQPDDVAAAVQQLRARADAAGNLKSSSQQQVRRVAAPPPSAGQPDAPEYYAIEPVDPDVVYVPIYDPDQVYGVWPYPGYRSFYWVPRGYVAVGVLAFGAPIVVGAALWATYDWRARRVAVDVKRFNTFNRTTLASPTWQHNPGHRGSLPYSNPVLQQKFGKAGTGVQGLSKTGVGGQPLPKAGLVTDPLLLPKGTTTKGTTTKGTTIKTDPANTKVIRNIDLGNTKGSTISSTTPGTTKPLGTSKPLNAVNPNLNKNATINRGVTVNQNVVLPKVNAGVQGAAKGPAAKGIKPKGQP